MLLLTTHPVYGPPPTEQGITLGTVTTADARGAAAQQITLWCGIGQKYIDYI